MNDKRSSGDGAAWLIEEDDVPTVSGTPTKESVSCTHEDWSDRNGFKTAVKSELYVECLLFFLHVCTL